MIRGALNDRRQPMVALEISNGDGRFQPVDALLDTGFSGYLTLPADTVAWLGLERIEKTPVVLAGDHQTQVSAHRGYVNWLGRVRRIDVLAMEGQALLGMNLLDGSKITVRVRAGGEVAIEEDREG